MLPETVSISVPKDIVIVVNLFFVNFRRSSLLGKCSFYLVWE